VRYTLPILACLVGLTSSSFSATVTWAAAEVSELRLPGGALVGSGNLVRLGYFKVSPEIVQQNGSNIAFLNENFEEFGSARIGEGFGGTAGEFAKTSTQPAAATQFDGKQMYVWGFASGDNSTVQSSLSTATHHGIFYMTGGPNSNRDLQDPEWLFPNASGLDGESSIDLADLTFDSTRLNQGARVLVGDFFTGEDFLLAAIPEPSSAALLSMAAVLVVGRRRQRC
jgi:hypothetical protein